MHAYIHTYIHTYIQNILLKALRCEFSIILREIRFDFLPWTRHVWIIYMHSVFTYGCMYLWIALSSSFYVYAYIQYVWLYVCMYICLYVWRYHHLLFMCAYMWMHVCVCMYVSVCVSNLCGASNQRLRKNGLPSSCCSRMTRIASWAVSVLEEVSINKYLCVAYILLY